jgi:hypothetical protein
VSQSACAAEIRVPLMFASGWKPQAMVPATTPVAANTSSVTRI